MKKCLFLVLSLLTISTFSFSQSLFRFGIRGGYDLIDQTINGDILKSANRTGYHVGLTMDANLPLLPFGVGASVLYTHLDVDTKDDTYTMDKAYFLDVPVNLKYTIGLSGDFGVVLSAGPYIRFNLDGGNINVSGITDTYKAKTFQAGANFGVGVDLSKHFYVGATYYTILTDSYADDNGDLKDVFDKKPDRMALTATYYF